MLYDTIVLEISISFYISYNNVTIIDIILLLYHIILCKILILSF